MFFSLLRKGINEELPGWPEVVVVFDGQDGSAQRKESDAGYKANRPGAPTQSAIRLWTPQHDGPRRYEMTHAATSKTARLARQLAANGPFPLVVAGDGFEPS
jgi:hypothetical protein